MENVKKMSREQKEDFSNMIMNLTLPEIEKAICKMREEQDRIEREDLKFMFHCLLRKYKIGNYRCRCAIEEVEELIHSESKGGKVIQFPQNRIKEGR